LWLKTGDLNDSYIYEIPEKITQKALFASSLKINPIGSILIAMYGATIGKVGILTQPATTNQACCACSDFKGIYNLYLFYLLIAYREYFIQLGEGGAQPNISKIKITSTYIPLPPLSEQYRIVTEIERLFSLVDIIEDNTLSLVQLFTQTKSKVLDLAIRGKLVPQGPSDEPVSVLLEQIGRRQKTKKSISDKFPYPFEIPNGWKWCKFSDLYLLISGRDLEKDEFNDTESGIPYLIGASSFNNNQFEINRWTNTPKVVSGKGDLLITCKGTVGDLIVNDIGDVHIARQFMAIRSTGITELKFTEYFFQYSISAIKESAKGVIPGIARKDILDIIIPLPPLSEQKRIISQIEKIFALLDMIGESLKA